jgi:hypothetical protein
MRGQSRFRLVLFFACVCAFALPARANAYVTAVKVYSPFDGNHLAKNLTVDSTVSGTCWTGSIASGQSDAWRCMVVNDIYDPCYTGYLSGDHVAVCSSPFSAHVTVIKLSAPLSSADANPSSGTKGDPSAIELGDGARCAMITGESNAINGMRLNYGCLGNAESAYGDPDRSSTLWKIHVMSTNGSKMRVVNVRVAWY